MSIAAYRQTIAECEDPRRIEYRLFLKITLDLERHNGSGSTSAGLKDALWRNMELWSALRADLLDEGNALPDGLRAGLISLSFTVTRHTKDVLAGSADADLLIYINRAVMQGLQGVPDAAARETVEAGHGA